ncbi:hypothetical protein CsNV_017 [Callinectes sapidus nudivirus]|nr:hypothetical protein CsNV_017 [Callinectes sapidus nudivirus]
MVDHPDTASVLSGGGIIGTSKLIPQAHWDLVTNHRCLGASRLSKLKELQLIYNEDLDYNMITDFLQALSEAIESEHKYLQNKNSKINLFKYLVIHGLRNFFCAYCATKKKSPHKSIHGLMTHLRHMHSSEIDKDFENLSDKSAYELYESKFKHINFKTHKDLTIEKLHSILAQENLIPSSSPSPAMDLSPQEVTIIANTLKNDEEFQSGISKDVTKLIELIESPQKTVEDVNEYCTDAIMNELSDLASDLMTPTPSPLTNSKTRPQLESLLLPTTYQLPDQPVILSPAPSSVSFASPMSSPSLSPLPSGNSTPTSNNLETINYNDIARDNQSKNKADIICMNANSTEYRNLNETSSVVKNMTVQALKRKNDDSHEESSCKKKKEESLENQVNSTVPMCMGRSTRKNLEMVESDSSSSESSDEDQPIVNNKIRKPIISRKGKKLTNEDINMMKSAADDSSDDELNTKKDENSKELQNKRGKKLIQQKHDADESQTKNGKKSSQKYVAMDSSDEDEPQPKKKSRKFTTQKNAACEESEEDEPQPKKRSKKSTKQKNVAYEESDEDEPQPKKSRKSTTQKNVVSDEDEVRQDRMNDLPIKKRGRKPAPKKTVPNKNVNETQSQSKKGSKKQVQEEESDEDVSNQKGKRSKNKRKQMPKNEQVNIGDSGLKIPKSTASTKKQSRDESNTYWSVELVNNLEQKAAELAKLDEPKATLYKYIQANINVENKQKKAVKAETSKAFKAFNNQHCNVKINTSTRDNVAFSSNCKINLDHFSKKTNKSNSQFNPCDLKRQLENFKFIYEGRSTSEVKKKMEESMKERCKNNEAIVQWKFLIKKLGSYSNAEIFRAKVKKNFNKTPEKAPTYPVLKALASLEVFDSNLGIQYKVNDGKPKALKNLVNQLIKGSLSNLKDVMESSEIANYMTWFNEFKVCKNNIAISNNLKWFLNQLTQVLKGSNSAMNPFSKISKTDIEKIMKIFTDYLFCRNERCEADYSLFSIGFFQNLTIFCMKYIFLVYCKILQLFKINPAKCQQPSDFHIGLFHDQNSMKNKKEDSKPPTELHDSYLQFMKNQSSKRKNGQISFLGIDRIALFLFNMKLIQSNLNIRSLDDLEPLFENESWEVFDLIESKCSTAVYNHIRSMLYEFLYDLSRNIIVDRIKDTIIYEKKITWDFFKDVLFKPEYYQYPTLVVQVLHDFQTLAFNGNGETPSPGSNHIHDNSPDAWHIVARKYEPLLFKELYQKFTINDSDDSDADEPMYDNSGVYDQEMELLSDSSDSD